jgi:hypothetical protein
MGKTTAHWSDERLDEFAAALGPVPVQVAVLQASVEHLDHVTAAMEPVPAQVAVLTAAAERLADENRALREDLATTERQLLQIGWALVAALLGAAAALIADLI